MDVPVTITGENAAPAGASESPISLPTSDLRSKGMEFLNNMDDTPAEKPAAVAKVATDALPEKVKGISEGTKPAVAAATETPTPAESARAAKQLADDDLVEVPVDGKIELRPWKDIKASASGEFKFTKSMQQLAAERKANAAELAQIADLKSAKENIRAFLGDKQAVAAFVQSQYPDLLTPAQAAAAVAEGIDPNEIATLGQVNDVVGSKLEQFQRLVQETEQKLLATADRKTAEIKRAEEVAKHSTAISSTLTSIFQEHPVLTAIPNVEDVIRFEVSKMVTPETTESEALVMFQEVAKEVAGKLRQHTVANQKIAAVAEAKTRMVSSIEPAGGSSVQTQPASFKNADGQVDMKRVKDLAKAYLAGM